MGTDYNKEAIKLVQKMREAVKKDGCGQWLFEETAICLAMFHVEQLAAVTAKKKYYELLLALKELEINIKTNNNE
jgi:hypothetical protein